MATFRTPEQWQALIKKQQQSELTVKAFCREHKISLSCFYRHKALNSSEPKSAFAQAVVESSATESSTPVVNHVITLTTQMGELTFPSQISPNVIIDVIKGLQS